jgi:PAS domain S-box-containing protein
MHPTSNDRTHTCKILVLDHTTETLADIVFLLSDAARIAVDVRQVCTVDEFESALKEQVWAIIISNFGIPELNPYQLLQLVAINQPNTPLFFIADQATVQDAVDVMRQGARGLVERNDLRRLAVMVREELENNLLVSGTSLPADPASYQSIVDNQREYICRYDTNYRLTFANRAYCEWRGKTAEALPGTSITELIAADEQEHLIRHLQQLTPEYPGATNIQYITLPDGTGCYIEWSDNAIFDNSGKLLEYQSVGRDITEKVRQAQELNSLKTELEVKSNHLNGILEVMQEAIMSISLVDHKIIFASASIEKVLGYPLEKFEENPDFFKKIIHPDDLEEVIRTRITALREGFAEIENRVILPDGQVRWLNRRAWVRYDTQGRPVSVIDISRDVTSHKQAEEAVRFSEEQLRSILGNMQDVVWSAGFPGFQISYVNPATSIVFGRPVSDFYQDNTLWFKVIYPDDIQKAQSLHDLVVTKGFRDAEYRIVRPDGEIRWLRDRAWLVRDNTGQPVRMDGITTDITERKTSEEALRQSEARYRLLAENMADVIWILDMATLRFSYVSPSVQTLRGYTPDEVLAQSLQEVMTPASIDLINIQFPQRLQDFLAGDHKATTQRHEIEQLCRDGSTVWTEVNTKLLVGDNGEIQILGLSRDISERKKAEELQRASEEKYRSLIESSDASIAMFDYTGKLLYANTIAAGALQMRSDELMGKNMHELFPPDVANYQLTSIQNVINTGKGIVSEATSYIAGEVRWFRTSVQPVRDARGKVTAGLIHATDITIFKQAEAALQESYEMLERKVVERTAELEKVKNRLEAIFNHSDDGILLLDVEKGIQQANIAFEELFELTPENYLGRKLSTLLDSEATGNIEKSIEEVVLTHQTCKVEAACKRPNGDTFHIEINISPVNRSVKSISSLVCIIRDVTERKQTEEDLRESEARYRMLVEKVRDAIFKQTSDTTITFGTPSVYNLTGYRPEELYGTSGLAMVHPDDLAVSQAIVTEAVLKGDSFVTFEERIRHKKGHYLWVELSYTIIRDPATAEPIELVGLIHDISERKQAEEDLRESEARYRMLAENINDVIVKLAPDSTCTFVTPSCYQLTGYTPEELIGKSVYELIHPDDVNQSIEKYIETVSSGKSFYTVSLRYLHKDGHYVWVEISTTLVSDQETGEMLETIGLVHDITERKQAEEALKKSEEKFRQLMESAPVATVITDTQGIVVLLNKITEQLFGYTKAELVGQDIEILVPKETDGIHLLEQAAATARIDKLQTISLDLTGLRKDGSIFPANVQLSYIDTPEGGLVMSHIIDITSRIETETALKHALEHEKELGALKSRFVSMASHEFRTPLAAILATTDTLTHYRDRMDKDQITTRLDKIRSQVNHMKDIMDDVLQLSRMQAGYMDFKPEQGDFEALCREIIEDFEVHTKPGNRIHFESAGIPLYAVYDKRLIRQALANIISNGLKYSPAENAVHITLSSEAERVIFKVRDTGIGIPTSELNHLFEPFHRASNVGTISGTGLGLSITRQAIERHGGTVSLESQLGIGTIVTVILPRILAEVDLKVTE